MTSARGSLDARWESSATGSAAWPPRAARSGLDHRTPLNVGPWRRATVARSGVIVVS
jgi:hypothetical protein